MPLRRDHRHIAQYGGHSGGAAPGISDPTAISNLVMWYDATQIPVLVDGDPVATWTDLSATGRNLTAAGVARPTFKTAIQNGHAIVRFNGTANVMATATFSLAQPFTYVIACKHVTVPANGTFEAMLGSTSDAVRFGTYVPVATPNFIITAGTILTGAAYDNAWNTHTLVFNGVSSQLRFNGSATSGAAGAGGFSSAAFGVGSGDAGSNNFGDVDVGEIAIYSGAVSAGDITLLETYFKTKWGTP